MMSVQGSCNECGISRTMVFLKKKQDAYLRPHDQIRFDNWQFDRRLRGKGWHNNWNYQLYQQGLYNQNTCDGYNHDNYQHDN